MSGQSNEGRISFSSEPSVASSHTLNSRNSGGAYPQDNGEGSSTQRESLSNTPRRASGVEQTMSHTRSQSSGSPLSVEAIDERDFALRKQRHRKSGGFLLDSNFGGGPRSRQSHAGAYIVDAKGNPQDKNGPKPRTGNGNASSSPLSREMRVAVEQGTLASRYRVDSPNTTHGQTNGAIQVAKRRSAQGMQSTDHERDADSSSTAPHATIDPNQIVHMALNLSESRRRNLASGQLLVPQSRAPSNAALDGSFHSQGTGGSLRQYLNEQRRSSRNISPVGKGSAARHMSSSGQRGASLFIHGRPFDPSDATIARRDKALAFFELRMEYLRLLDLLPPLKPDSSEPGNFIVTANNVPGSPHVHLTRTPSYAGKIYPLGRQYNPLQSLRNRRLRARERKALEHTPEEFANVNQVRDWVDRVEREAAYPHYRHTDGVNLPIFHEHHDQPITPSQPSRPSKVWMFTSEELLADAHWMELGDHKPLIEDRYGSKIFPQREPQKQEFLQPRPSKDYSEKRRRSWIEGLPGIPADNTTGDESEAVSDRGRKRRLLPTFRAESPKPKHKKHGNFMPGGRHSDSSDSESDAGRNGQGKPIVMLDSNKDTAPLQRRMKELMEKEAQEAQFKSESPAVFTPDTPDKWGREHAVESVRNSIDVPQSNSSSIRLTTDLGLRLPPTTRTDHDHAMDPTKEPPRSSFDDITSPSTPLHRGHFYHTSSDLSPPLSRTGSLQKKAKKSKLDIFRSDENSKQNKNEEGLAPVITSPDKKQRSRQPSEEAEDSSGIGAAIWAAPGAVKSLLGHRRNESLNDLQSPIKEPHSAVTRFFKGVKHEGSKVQEFIFRKDRAPDETDSDTSDTDTENEADRKHRPGLARTTTAETMSSTTSKTGRYHLDLPSFRSSYKIDGDGGYSTDPLSDHVTRQARERVNSRPPRFDQLAPPPMDLSRISSKESTNQGHIREVLARPGGVGLGGLPMTALAQSDDRPKLEGKRHWSITDENGNVIQSKTTPTIVTAADIARVRALFLCSGVKAKEISGRALQIRPSPPPFLKRAAETANAHLYPVQRKEEHVLAARILVNNIEASTSTLEASATEFRDGKVKELTSLITNLKSHIESELFPRVRSSSDEAVQITSEVSSSAPLTVKQVSDEIDRMLRVRRRRMRWVRRVGWTAVEWMLLGVMWFAWLMVTVIGAFGRVFGVVWRVVKWLLWM